MITRPAEPSLAEELPFTPLSPRLACFLAASRARCAMPTPSPRGPHFDHAFFTRYVTRPYWERYARSLAFALESEPVYLFNDEHLVGMLYQGAPGPDGYVKDEERWASYEPWKQAI